MGKTLYQYTDTVALAGIVESCAIRATDFRYLNDSLELSYVWDALVSRLNALSKEPDDGHRYAYNTMLDAIRRLRAENLRTYDQSVFVACFTELKDAVSQWSRYGANGHGVALGFDADKIGGLRSGYHHHHPDGKLSPVLDQNQMPLIWPCPLQPVEYGDSARDALVTRLVEMVCSIGTTNDSATDAFNYIHQLGGILPHVSLVKHEAFKDECEHRITASEHFGDMTPLHRDAIGNLGAEFRPFTNVPATTLDVKFRPSGATLFTPYIELTLPRDALVTVVLGPSVTDPLAPVTVRRLLQRHGYPDTDVEQSELPYQS
ncbi:DUF2971 domain-containing protein [Rhodococcus sp. 06-156-3C]|uniref:DUF2971 domain-containing protein n=1 Tax=Rhodococcoides fascians TaxID=1828 RepID=UPI000522E3AD|nr:MULTISPECIES: DUF2971 domain-containing protein [Rhodococcus]OZD18345.1 DUF2971 domain-containing protein [Rhodococcus sp. 06-156-4C]OZD18943.1 DUF2971 domain-containing protein [Rhodococcus sp. 06-156-3C]OZD22453.1 DUF2971 domain-containing protein [Rhodococcus sp. 06-156-4a]OZD34037.1 DUF2971 domain-containing protein [Rhodococcus sp. 06-156-3b]OZD38774.1 DUF2971 domain-containing protein [Rhodococcus sp. 06-156-3]